MNTIEIINELKDIECFKGVLPLDKLRSMKINQKPFAIIINLDYSNEPGSHWVTLFIDENNEGYYFDSFGFPNFSNEMLYFLRNNKINKINFNKYFIQSKNSDNCGAYCVLFVKMLCNGYSMREFLNLFSNNTEENDEISVKILE